MRASFIMMSRLKLAKGSLYLHNSATKRQNIAHNSSIDHSQLLKLPVFSRDININTFEHL